MKPRTKNEALAEVIKRMHRAMQGEKETVDPMNKKLTPDDVNPLLALARFGRRCLDLYSGTGNIDGGAAYCSMMEHGLVEDKLMSEPCGELCKCAYLYQYVFPLTCRQETALAQLPEKRE